MTAENVPDTVPVPRAALNDLQAALRFLAWADAQEGHAPVAMAVEWLQSIGKGIFRE